MLARVPVAAWPAAWFEVQDNIRRADVLLASAVAPYPGPDAAPGAAIAAALARGPEGVLAELKSTHLRGRGGAGFATAQKWALCRQAPGAEHVVVCNADQGEPGTLKDRVLLTRCADAVFEGMTIAAHVLGARLGLVYLRGEYRYLLDALTAVLVRRRAAGLLGTGILGRAGFDFDITIHVGAGAYVCGEESSLIESLEGQRGTPRIRPPFPVEQGYLGWPTVVNNVETFCAAGHIARRGGAWWASIGTPASTGTKIHSVSGDCARPGIYEYPFGTPVSQILADYGAVAVQAVQVGGPSGVCLGRPMSLTAASASKTCPRPALSWCSTTAATCSRWRMASRNTLRMRAVASARPAAWAPRWWSSAWTSSPAARARQTTWPCWPS